ncbi:MAG: YfhO family protein [Candidatus Omnitrophota bacterium]
MIKQFLRHIVIPAVLLLLLSAAFYDVIFFNKTFKVTTANSQALPTGVYGQEDNKPPFIPVNGTDSPVLEEPVYAFLKHHLQQGRLPLWNPHQGCGYPLIGMLQVGIFFPVTAIMYLFPSLFAWDILILTRLFLSGLFMFGMMRYFRFRQIPSFAAAVIFMLSGPMVLLQYWTTNVDILLPVLILTLESLLRRTTLRRTALLAGVVAMTILAGHPEHILLVNLYGLLFFLYRIFALRRPFLRSMILYAGAYLGGIGLSAAAFFPFIYNFLFHFWHGHPSGTGLLMEEQPARAITLALPHFFQKAPITYQWVFAGWWGGYLGTLPLGLAVASLWKKQKRGLNIFFAVMAGAVLAKAYGLPIINWIGHIPPFDLPRYAIHSPPLAAFSAAAAAGMGVRLCQKKPPLQGAIIFSAGLMLITATHLLVLKNSEHITLSLRAAAYALALLIIWLILLTLRKQKILSARITGLLLCGLVFLELASYIHRERPERFDSFPPVPYIEQLKTAPQPVRSYGNFWAFYPNTATGYGVDDLGYFFGLVPKRYVHFVNRLLIPEHFQADFRSPSLRAIPIQNRETILNLLNVGYIIAPSDNRLISRFPHFRPLGDYLHRVYDGEVRVFQRPDVFPRAFVTHRAVFEPNPERHLDYVHALRSRLRNVAIIQAPPDKKIRDALQNTPSRNRSTAYITLHTPNRVEVRAFMEHPGMLVLSETYHPGWKALVNGEPAELYPADYLFRSVFLPAGTHTVEFVFQPKDFFAGIAVSLFSFLVLAGILFFRIKKPSGH